MNRFLFRILIIIVLCIRTVLYIFAEKDIHFQFL